MVNPKVIDIPMHTDDRGYVYCVMDDMLFYNIKRTYIVENFEQGIVRAWHGHRSGDTFMHVLRGSVKLAAMKMEDHGKVITAVLSERKPQLFKIPAGYYNGAVSLTKGTRILVYSTLTFAQCKLDDERVTWKINKDIWEVDNR